VRLPAPRWQTPLPPDRSLGSWGPDVEAWAWANLGLRFDRWQRRAVNRALAYYLDTGELVHRIYLISIARQGGKTAIVRAILGWALTARATAPWSTLLGLANDRKQARIPYEAVLADLAPMARRLGPPARGGLALTRYLGIRSGMYGRTRSYDVASRDARDAIRGTSNDLAVFDEVRTQRDRLTWDALEPTITARPQPLILLTSTAGDDRSILLRELWERGLRVIDGVESAAGFGMTWYAAADGLAPDDPRGWRQANPALAEGRLPIAAIRNSYHALAPAGFRSERLNLWSEGGDEWLPPGAWVRQIGPQPAEGVRTVLGVEAVPSWRRATVTVVLLTDAGAWAGVAGELDASRTSSASIPPADLTRLVSRLIAQWRPDYVAYSAAAAAGPYAEAAAGEARVPVVALGPRQIRAGSAMLRAELVGGRLTHSDDPMLAMQIRAARPSGAIEGGDWYLSIRESTGEIDAVRAVAWALFAAIAPPDVPTLPQVFV